MSMGRTKQQAITRKESTAKKILAKEELGMNMKKMYVTRRLTKGARHALHHVPKRLPNLQLKGAEMRKLSWKLLTMMLKKHLLQKYQEGHMALPLPLVNAQGH